MPKSVPCLVLDKVRHVFVSEVLNSNVLVQKVPNKSLSQELCAQACNIDILLIEWMLPF